jgi:hypothetical protein
MAGWNNTWIRLHSIRGFEFLTLDVMRDDEVWARKQIDASDFDGSVEQVLEVVRDYWDAICDSNSEEAA